MIIIIMTIIIAIIIDLLVTLQSDSIFVAVNSAAAEEIETAPLEIPNDKTDHDDDR